MSPPDTGDIDYRPLVAAHLDRLGDIDRSERIDAIYLQHGTQLEKREGDFSSPPWTREGDGEHSVAHKRAECERCLEAGGSGVAAFEGERLVGLGLVVPHIRPGVAQLAFLHVSNGQRGRGVGVRIVDELERVAREQDDLEMVVSATRSEHTVHFYMGRGFEPMAEPLPELYALEPEDIHMHKRLRAPA